MEVVLTPDQEAFLQAAIEAGRLRRAEDAVTEALVLWEERERRRAAILAHIDDPEASLARGDGGTLTPRSVQELAAAVKRRGRARLAEEREAASD